MIVLSQERSFEEEEKESLKERENALEKEHFIRDAVKRMEKRYDQNNSQNDKSTTKPGKD